MGDNEIIRALECCGNQNYSCTDKLCKAKVMGEAVELIKRQQAEKEALIAGQETLQKALAEKIAILEEIDNEINPLPFVTDFEKAIRSAKSEAIKEFAEKVKDIIDEPSLIRGCVIDSIILNIDNLVKELTEVKDDE